MLGDGLCWGDASERSPIGLIERLVLALTNKGELVFDPFSGVASAGAAAALHGRRFWGCDIMEDYCKIGSKRINEALIGKLNYRPHDKPIYDYRKSKLSIWPKELRQGISE